MATNVTEKDKTLNEIIDISPTPYDCKPMTHSWKARTRNERVPTCS